MQKKDDKFPLSASSWWNPKEFLKKKHFLEQRALILAAIRSYFLSEKFFEVETPALQISPGLEPHLKAFKTELENPFGMDPETLYLHTSPEFTMKKLLVAGAGNIFQLARCYRNSERSSTHHPEFTMLEWYRVHASYEKIMDDCVALLRACMKTIPSCSIFTWNNVRCDPSKEWERISVCDAFLKYTEIDLMKTIDKHEVPSREKLAAAANAIGISVQEKDSWEDIFFRIFLERIEGKLGIGVPTILYDYPISMAALSRPKPTDSRFAERFELYICGLELANAFCELTDARVQRRRFEEDMNKEEKLYGIRYPIDEDFLSALEFGYPESSGIALGIDRLVMLVTGAKHIDDVLWAPVQGIRV